VPPAPPRPAAKTDPFADLPPVRQRPARAAAKPPAAAKPAAAVRVPLPATRDMDKELKQVWQAAEAAGVQVKSIKTLKTVRGPGYTTQPVQFTAAGRFEGVYAFLRTLHGSFPHVSVEQLDLSQNKAAPGGATAALPVGLTLHWHLTADQATGTATDVPAPTDMSRLLFVVAQQLGRDMTLLGFSFRTSPSDRVQATPPLNVATVVGAARSDVDVARFLSQLNTSDGVRDVNLVSSDADTFAGQPVRRFTLQFATRPDAPTASKGAPATADAADRDPFRAAAPPTPAPASAAATAAATAAANPPDGRQAVLRAAQRLRLQAVMATGPRKTCMINNVSYAEGGQVGQFTIDSIREGTVVVRSGRYRFELAMAK
jgi:hypothetical protein